MTFQERGDVGEKIFLLKNEDVFLKNLESY